MRQSSLIDYRDGRRYPSYRPPDLPDLSSEEEVTVDFETSGLRWWAGDKPCGMAVSTRDGREWYLPWGHLPGGNIPEENVNRWMRSYEGLRGKRLSGWKTSFDAHMGRVQLGGEGFDDLGCTYTDVSHHAALLDDSRKKFDLDTVGRRYLGRGKVDLDVSHGAHIYHAAEVERYAMGDAALTRDLQLHFEPLLEEEELLDVLELEDEVIPVVVEMESNGAYLDEELLDSYTRDCRAEIVRSTWDLYSAAGFKMNPRSTKDLRKLFSLINIPIPTMSDLPRHHPDFGRETFEDRYLAPIEHPAVKRCRTIRNLMNLDSKFLTVYREELNRRGHLIYALNQLRSDEGGTISGRFSSSSYTSSPREGVNVQQVGGKKQLARLKNVDPALARFSIRRLYRPQSGLWMRADAKQIEYRLFAHYAQPATVIAAYRRDPETDYHDIVMGMLRAIVATITRERTKDLNFAMLYGAGVEKIAWMLGLTVAETRTFVDAYIAAFPEAGRLLRYAMQIMEERGYVKTILGRRARFQDRSMLHSALNRIIQGTAADINKRKLVELHRERKRLGLTMRFTVHDEADGDVPDVEAARMVKEVLDRQSFELNVPILWDVAVGPSWAEADKIGVAA